jgi:MFS family permease
VTVGNKGSKPAASHYAVKQIEDIYSSGLDLPKEDVVEEFDLAYYRWLILGLMMCLTCLNNCICFSLAPISHHAHEYYQDVDLGALASIYFMANVVFSYHGAQLTESKGLYTCVAAGALLQAVGCWLRCANVPGSGFNTLYLGQFLAACGQPFITNIGPAVSMAWFGEDETAMATSLQGGANQLGIAVAYIWASQAVETAADVPGYMQSVAIAATVVTMLVIILYRSAPSKAPSIAAAQKLADSTKFGFDDLLDVFSQPGFLLTVLGFTVAETLLNVCT